MTANPIKTTITVCGGQLPRGLISMPVLGAKLPRWQRFVNWLTRSDVYTVPHVLYVVTRVIDSSTVEIERFYRD